PQAQATQKFITEAQKPEYQKIYASGGSDIDVLKAIYNQASLEVKSVKPVEKVVKKPRKVNYLNNKDLLKEVLLSKEREQMTNKLAHGPWLIAHSKTKTKFKIAELRLSSII
ncbi:hypothetical protein LCGC14_2858330, partial [marine sediment metagenome]